MRFEKFYSIRGFGGILRFEIFFREGVGGDFLRFEKFFEVRLTVRGGLAKVSYPCQGGPKWPNKRQLILEWPLILDLEWPKGLRRPGNITYDYFGRVSRRYKYIFCCTYQVPWIPGFGNAKSYLDPGNSDFKIEFWLLICMDLDIFVSFVDFKFELIKTVKNYSETVTLLKNWSWKSSVPRSRFFPTRGRSIFNFFV